MIELLEKSKPEVGSPALIPTRSLLDVKLR
jgi:hypothetical protein